ncbi:hypothetical protein [Magnetofaba australis]|uniref:Uncharacterized protein n=1 Tax=Magnetofaba australis IT-1 TaxID=1434232 RepID=A0A1Y2K2X9_9PROT|nr:hypothetical protein [Magnetofaba australis]OSM02312.1 hypothetical protein MAIT1_02434 [Magnetofaba australis IT-1]
MKKIALVLMALSLLGAAPNAFADPAKGGKYYLKIFKPKTGYNGTKFASMHTRDEWKRLFDNDGYGFIAEFGAKHPSLKKFLYSDQFKIKLMPHIRDFAIEYASDSGNVPRD